MVGFRVEGPQVKVSNVVRRRVYHVNMSDVSKIIATYVFGSFKAINTVYVRFFNVTVPLNIYFSSVLPQSVDLHEEGKASDDSFPMIDKEIQFGSPRY